MTAFALLVFLLFPSPAFADGAIRLKTDVSQVTVILDGKEAGEAPLTISSVSPGKHRLRLIRPGFEDHVEEVQVLAGTTAKLFVVMRPNSTPLPDLPVTVRVAHQHRTGLCRGELTITSDSIRFKADDGQDTFNIPIAEIKSVSRSWGSVPGIGMPALDLNQGNMGDLIPVRIEGPGRSYGFIGHVDDKEWKDVPLDAAMTQVTKNIYDLIYRIWQASLDEKKKTDR